MLCGVPWGSCVVRQCAVCGVRGGVCLGWSSRGGQWRHGDASRVRRLLWGAWVGMLAAAEACSVLGC